MGYVVEKKEEIVWWVVTVALYVLVLCCYVVRLVVVVKCIRQEWTEELNKRVVSVRLASFLVILGADFLSLFSFTNLFIVIEILVETLLTLCVLHCARKAEHRSLQEMKSLSIYSSVVSLDSHGHALS